MKRLPGDAVYFAARRKKDAYVEGRLVRRYWMFGWWFLVEYDVDCYQHRGYDTRATLVRRVWSAIPSVGRHMRTTMDLAEAARGFRGERW